MGVDVGKVYMVGCIVVVLIVAGVVSRMGYGAGRSQGHKEVANYVLFYSIGIGGGSKALPAVRVGQLWTWAK